MSEKIQRYHLKPNDGDEWHLLPADEGDFCHDEDVRKLEEERDELREKLEEACKLLESKQAHLRRLFKLEEGKAKGNYDFCFALTEMNIKELVPVIDSFLSQLNPEKTKGDE